MLRVLASAAILGLFSGDFGAAYAQGRPGEPAAERYSFQTTDTGVLRFDSRTGEISQCTISATGPICRAAPEERTALENEVARLQAENTELKKALANRDGAPPVPPASIPEATDKSPAPDSSAPSAQNEQQPTKGRIRTALDTAWRNVVALMSRLKSAVQ